jgi:hypothetical protein
MTENLSPETLADGAQLTPADGGGTVETPALTLADLNKQLGATFKDVPTALQALKDTQSYVGKRKEDIAAEVKAGLQQTASSTQLESKVQTLENQLFYTSNPQFKGYEALINSMGANPAEVVNSPVFKEVYEKATKADEIVNSRSVVSSNARLSQAKTVIDSAIGVANARGSTNEDVASIFAQAINQQNQQGN